VGEKANRELEHRVAELTVERDEACDERDMFCAERDALRDYLRGMWDESRERRCGAVTLGIVKKHRSEAESLNAEADKLRIAYSQSRADLVNALQERDEARNEAESFKDAAKYLRNERDALIRYLIGKWGPDCEEICCLATLEVVGVHRKAALDVVKSREQLATALSRSQAELVDAVKVAKSVVKTEPGVCDDRVADELWRLERVAGLVARAHGAPDDLGPLESLAWVAGYVSGTGDR